MYSFLLALLFISSYTTACTADWQCTNVSANFNYVKCDSSTQQCRCLNEFGFSGNATISNKCNCLSPYSVYWSQQLPYCINYNDAVQYKLDKAKAEYQKNQVKQVYLSSLWPTPVALMQSLIVGNRTWYSDMFDDNAVGRIDPFGVLAGAPFIVPEYFISPVWQEDIARNLNATFINLISDGNTVYVRVHLWAANMVYGQIPGVIATTYQLIQSGHFIFNNQGKIQSLQLSVSMLGAKPDNNVPVVFRPQLAQFVCLLVIVRAGCNQTNDPDGYYTDFNDCYNYMLNSWPWGNWYDLSLASGNSTQCR